MDQNLKDQLMISFHDQFAENQNHHQQSFIQVLSVLLTVIIGYGYVLSNGGDFDQEYKVDSFLLQTAFVIASIINCFGILVILNNAHAFRRDQFVVSKIRETAGLISDDPNQNSNFIFPSNFNPSKSYLEKKKRWEKYKSKRWFYQYDVNKRYHFAVSWMPNFYNILFLVLGILHLILFASLLLNPYDNITLDLDRDLNIGWTHVFAGAIWLSTSYYVVSRVRHFRSDLEQHYN
jgi:hypothetical protein